MNLYWLYYKAFIENEFYSNYYLWEILELVLLTYPLNQLHETHQKATCTSNLLWYLICFATKATTFLWWQMISWWLPVDYSVSTTVGFFFHWSIKVMRQKRVLNKKKTTRINFFNIIVVIILWSPIKVCGKKQLKQSYIYMLNILLRKKITLNVVL